MPPLSALSRRAAVALAALAALAPTAEAKKKRKKCKPLAVGARCSTTRQCCGTTTNLSCAANESGNSGGPVCCGTAGVGCGSDDDCCSGFLCGGGACAVEP